MVGAISLVQGCSASRLDEFDRAAVSGTVTLDGKPLSEGVINFIPQADTQGPKTSVVITQGKFEVDNRHGPLIGQHRVEIRSTDDGGFALDDESSIDRLKASRKRKIEVVVIPTIYNDRSKLSEEVSESDSNQYQFKLLSRPKR
ncbi:MAG: hypothetical protein COA78_02245 [Blastopirellula sp.]|nr:MAG: hypothetical protein COA78_02245 [Blastopirellula sp.]